MIDKKTGIYKVTNLISNKVYIGQTTNFHQRKIDHFKASALNQCPLSLHSEMALIGKENFSMVLIEECGRDELDEKERYWTDLYKADHDMYNIVSGNPSYSEYNSEIQSERFTEMNKANWKDPEYRLRTSKRSSELQKKRLQNPEYLAEKSEQLKKYTDKIKKKVAQYDMDGNLVKVYDGVRIAERDTGVGSSLISAVAKHKKYRKSAGGYRWEYI